MKIISFSWTTPALLAGRKTVTRRDWPARYERQFKPGDLCQAYDRNPRNGGKCVAIIRLLSVTYEPLRQMPDEDFEHEGFAYMIEIGKKPPFDFEEWRRTPENRTVVRFTLHRLIHGKKAVEGLRLRHNLPVGSARGKHDLPIGYFLCETLEDREIAARPYVKQFIQESRVIRALYGDDRRLKELYGQLQLSLSARADSGAARG